MIAELSSVMQSGCKRAHKLLAVGTIAISRVLLKTNRDLRDRYTVS
jgi:hypothetical protein